MMACVLSWQTESLSFAFSPKEKRVDGVGRHGAESEKKRRRGKVESGVADEPTARRCQGDVTSAAPAEDHVTARTNLRLQQNLV